jgi:hypothetical protein
MGMGGFDIKPFLQFPPNLDSVKAGEILFKKLPYASTRPCMIGV